MEVHLPDPGPVIHTIDPAFLSYTLDISYLLGGHWWGNEKKTCRALGSRIVPPLDLSNPDLIRWAFYLSPAILRIGGTEADRVYYKVKKKLPVPEKPRVDYKLVLKKKQWKRIISFAKKSGAQLLFTLSCGWADRTEEGDWDSANAQRLIAYTARKKLPVLGWELGNEVNGYPFIEGVRFRVTAKQYAKDFQKFSRLVQELHPDALAIGPASAFWPRVGEPHPIIPELLSQGAMGSEDVVSWHYYPFQSSRGAVAIRRANLRRSLSPVVFKEAEKYARTLRERAGNREVWLTETGHALYGGEPGLSDTCVSTPWWLDLLGRMALTGVRRVFRQTLVGSDYGLLNPETLEPRPDYYASFLWKRLMGEGVFQLSPSPSKNLIWYCHTAKRKAQKKKDYTYLLINLDREPVSVVTCASLRQRYVLQPAGPLTSHYLLLNDTLMESDLVTKFRKRKTKEKYRVKPEFNCPGREDAEGQSKGDQRSTVTLPPFSCAFLVVRF